MINLICSCMTVTQTTDSWSLSPKINDIGFFISSEKDHME